MKGKGFTEFLCCKDEIESLLEEGHSIFQVHKKLSESGKITTKYKNFHRILHALKMKPATARKIEYGDDVMKKAYKYIENKKNKWKIQIKFPVNNNKEAINNCDKNEEFGIIKNSEDEIF